MHDSHGINCLAHACRGLLLICVFVAPTLGDDPPPEPTTLEAALDRDRVFDGFQVTATVEKTEFQHGEPIELRVEVRDVSDVPETVPGYGPYFPYASYTLFRLRAFDEKGEILPKTRFLTKDAPLRSREVGSSISSVRFSVPSEGCRTKLLANLAYDMTAVGEYTILVEVPTNRILDDGRRLYGQSEPVRVRVLEVSPAMIHVPNSFD